MTGMRNILIPYSRVGLCAAGEVGRYRLFGVSLPLLIAAAAGAIGDSLINALPFNFSGTESAMRRVIAVAVASVFIAGCAGTTGDQSADPAPAPRLTAAERETEREARLALRDEALERLYELQPEARKGIESAPGYAVFDVSSVFIVLFVGQRGKGVLIDNATKKPTFMTSSRAGTGPGAGTTRVLQIFVFKVRSAMDQFVLAGGLGGDVGASAGIGAGGIVRSFNPQNGYPFDAREVC